MPSYNNFENDVNMQSRQRDLVLSVNEFCFMQNKTNGVIKTYVGPMTMTISQTEALVVFDPRSKKFVEQNNFEKAKQLCVAAPEGWYVILKNPTDDDHRPEAGKANAIPQSMEIGTKVNIPGPVSFALYPGQMSKVVRGHKLRSNQYLIARVYDAEAAAKGMKDATIVSVNNDENAKGNSEENEENKESQNKFFVGQQLVIKGTEVSFYMPPTGIEVVPQTQGSDDYIRDAVTLERLEYAILKDEDGEKRYVHGPAVVFPKPTETFVETPKKGVIFRALELSPISGIYIKVIADYKDENDKEHKIGEELFITGKEQMIYYPRPEHAIIQYDGKYMHHAIAIPEGEGRYIMNRLTGDIETVKGPKMFLPDPRTQVVVKRKLSPTECRLLYPGNKEVEEYNAILNEKAMEKRAKNGNADVGSMNAVATQAATLAIFEANANISRGSSYTKPRTITLDTKYDGVVAVNVWPGYAINVSNKKGGHEVIVGPSTKLLDYDETVEAITLDNGPVAYLPLNNRAISDTIFAKTSDNIEVRIDFNTVLSFKEEFENKWFSIEAPVKYLKNKLRKMIKAGIRAYTLNEFYANASEIVENIVLNGKEEKVFEINGMCISDVSCEVVYSNGAATLIENFNSNIIKLQFKHEEAELQKALNEKLAIIDREKQTRDNENAKHALNMKKQLEEEKLAHQAAMAEKQRAMDEAVVKAEADSQAILDMIEKAKLERQKAVVDAKIAKDKAEAEVEKAKMEAYAQTVKTIMESISEDLVAAMNASSNAEMLSTVTKSVAPYAMARNESVSDFTNKLLRGTPLEGVIEQMANRK